jgi:hypothetical protein
MSTRYFGPLDMFPSTTSSTIRQSMRTVFKLELHVAEPTLYSSLREAIRGLFASLINIQPSFVDLRCGK